MTGQVVGNGLIYGSDGDYYRFSGEKFDIGENVEFKPDESGTLATEIKITKGEIIDTKSRAKNPFEIFSIKEKINNLKNIKLPKKGDIKTLSSKSKSGLSLKIPNLKFGGFKKPVFEKPTSNKNQNKEITKPVINLKEPNIEIKEQTNSFFEPPVFDLKKDENLKNNEFENVEPKREIYEKNLSSSIEITPLKHLRLKEIDDEKSSKKETRTQPLKELRVAKILAISGVLAFMAGFVIFTIYSDRAASQATFCFVLLYISYIIMTYKALSLVGERAGAKDLARNFLKSIFYPVILAFVLGFVISFSSAFLDGFNTKEQFYIISGASLIAIIWWISYFISINKKVYITLSNITRVELFRVYMILYIISNITFSLISIITNHPEWIIFMPQNLLNIILGFTVIITLAILGVAISMYAIYIISWVKAKEIKKFWL